MGRTNMRYPYPEAGGLSQPQRAAGQPLPFTTEKHTGSGIEPGLSDCEATVFPRRHCTPLRDMVDLLYGITATRVDGSFPLRVPCSVCYRLTISCFVYNYFRTGNKYCFVHPN